MVAYETYAKKLRLLRELIFHYDGDVHDPAVSDYIVRTIAEWEGRMLSGKDPEYGYISVMKQCNVWYKEYTT